MKRKRDNKESRIDDGKIQFWHIDRDYNIDNLDSILRLSNKATKPETCSELTDDNQLFCFLF